MNQLWHINNKLDPFFKFFFFNYYSDLAHFLNAQIKTSSIVT